MNENRRRQPTPTRSSRSGAPSSRELREQGNAFPNDFRRGTGRGCSRTRRQDNEALDEGAAGAGRIAGRIMLKRVMGKASFATIQDMSGRIQLYVTNDTHRRGRARGLQALGPRRHRRREGTLFKTKTGELTVRVESAPAHQVAAPAAGEVPRPDRPGAALPPALRRPDHQRGHARTLRAALARHPGDPRVLIAAATSKSKRR
jgi:lysyl-tRNA synthetase class II